MDFDEPLEFSAIVNNSLGFILLHKSSLSTDFFLTTELRGKRVTELIQLTLAWKKFIV